MSYAEFAGRVGQDDLCELYARCRALILPGEEDFGMTSVEALASGKPVIALGRGGALEVVPAFGGVFYKESTREELSGAIKSLEALEPHVRPAALQQSAKRFSQTEFFRKMSAVLQISESVQTESQADGFRSESFLAQGL